MGNEKEFREKFIRMLDSMTEMFRSGEISVIMGLKIEISLEKITSREKLFNQVKAVAVEHYSGNKFKDTRAKIILGWDMMSEQIQNLKKQLSEAEQSTGLQFDQNKFIEGYGIVRRAVTSIQT